MDINSIIDGIIDREAGFVDHPLDHGGPTNMGITLSTLKNYRGKPVTVDDIKNLKRDEVVAIYTKMYLTDSGIIKISDDNLQMVMLDAAVHHGPPRAIKLLQAALGVREDGIIGEQTLSAIPYLDCRKVAMRVMANRIRLFGRIISRDHTQSAFAGGWMNRAADLIESIA